MNTEPRNEHNGYEWKSPFADDLAGWLRFRGYLDGAILGEDASIGDQMEILDRLGWGYSLVNVTWLDFDEGPYPIGSPSFSVWIVFPDDEVAEDPFEINGTAPGDPIPHANLVKLSISYVMKTAVEAAKHHADERIEDLRAQEQGG